ncbi:MAG: hypothetical protein GX256_07235 [Fretibacterium sp.]|nr:hypothetical protein [Fretibacterium sp.]
MTENDVITVPQTTERENLEREIELLTRQELVELTRYAGYLRYSRAQKDDDWADAPLTVEEEKAFEAGRTNLERGDYLTLEEFRKQVAAL